LLTDISMTRFPTWQLFFHISAKPKERSYAELGSVQVGEKREHECTTSRQDKKQLRKTYQDL